MLAIFRAPMQCLKSMPDASVTSLNWGTGACALEPVTGTNRSPKIAAAAHTAMTQVLWRDKDIGSVLQAAECRCAGPVIVRRTCVRVETRTAAHDTQQRTDFGRLRGENYHTGPGTSR